MIPCTGKQLHDYVPLYFGFKTPMVAANQHQNENLIFLRFSLDIFSKSGVVFCGGNARANETRFYQLGSTDDLKVLDVKAISSVKYAHSADFKRKKQADILVPDFLSLDFVLDIIVFSPEALKRLMDLLKEFSSKKPAKVNRGWYFYDQEVTK